MRTVLAVDGGNSKTDVAIVAEDGRLLAAVRGATISHQAVGLAAGMERLAALTAEAVAISSTRRASRPGCVLPGRGGHTPTTCGSSRPLSTERGFAAEQLVLNDAFGALRAGTDRAWGVVVICGQGVNAAGIAPDGRTARLDALGEISGDWGGGTDVGWAGSQRRSGRGTAAARGPASSMTSRRTGG